MKFRVILLCVLLIGASLFSVSCRKEDGADLSSESGVSRHSDSGEEKEVVFDAVYSRTDGYFEEKTYPYVTVLNTRAQLEQYTAEHEGQFNFYDNASSDSFYNIVTAYDAAFFADYSIIMIMVKEESGSVRHTVEDVVCQDGKTTVTLGRILPDGDTTDDEAFWHVMIKLPKDSPVLEHPDAISVVLKNKAE